MGRLSLRKSLSVAFTLFTVLTLFIGIAIFNLPAVVEWVAPFALERLGLNGDLRVSQFGWKQATFLDLWIGAQESRIAHSLSFNAVSANQIATSKEELTAAGMSSPRVRSKSWVTCLVPPSNIELNS